MRPYMKRNHCGGCGCEIGFKYGLWYRLLDWSYLLHSWQLDPNRDCPGHYQHHSLQVVHREPYSFHL